MTAATRERSRLERITTYLVTAYKFIKFVFDVYTLVTTGH
jgi:hypothetical protein